MGIEESEKKEKDDITITLFPNLISLQFDELREWEEWNGIGGEEEEDCTRRFSIMPRLRHLSIWGCRKLESLPNFLRTTPLQELEVRRCRNLEERYKSGTAEEWSKISHIPKIIFSPFHKQKIVIKVHVRCQKCRTEALTVAAKANGVITASLEGVDKDKVVVIGEGVDAASLATTLRKKVGYAVLVSVEEVKKRNSVGKPYTHTLDYWNSF